MSQVQVKRTGEGSDSNQISLTPTPSNPSDTRLHEVKALYFVTADAEPNMLPRLIEPFAKLGLVPDRVHCDRDAFHSCTLRVDLRAAELSNHYAMLIEKALRSVVGVQTVITVLE